jgi:hypothetical protein
MADDGKLCFSPSVLRSSLSHFKRLAIGLIADIINLEIQRKSWLNKSHYPRRL